MSTWIPTASASSPAAAATAAAAADNVALFTNVVPSSPFSLSLRPFPSYSNALLSLSSNPKPRLLSQSTQSAWRRGVAIKAQLNNVGMDGSSSSAISHSTSEASMQEVKNGKLSAESVDTPLASEDSISEFITQVAGLVKLVDSRDIVELHLKQNDCELVIRKREAIEPPAPAPVFMTHLPSPPTVVPQATPIAAPPTSSPPPAPSAVKPAKSSAPPFKSPMAGTFYRSPAPGAPPFVKVGDKVQKGQVICIIEAMKLMNEIEADQAGTIVEILAEDGKPISLDTPLFAIQS